MTTELQNITIFDTTLRDGEQSPGAAMTHEEKLRIAELLDEMGVDVIEAGFPISSAGDFKAVGIPDSAAKNIVDYRDKHDGFRSIDELSQVPGVSSSMIAPLRGKLSLSPKH